MIVVDVTCHLLRPAVIDGPLHLDALLTARHPAMHTRDCSVTRKSGGRPMVAPLPLAVARIGGAWVWCASAACPAGPDGVAAIVKRRDGVDYLMTQRTVYPSVGPDRDRLKRVMTVQALPPFRAAVLGPSDVKELRRLLRRVDQVGGLRKSGYGVVREWEVAEVEAVPETCLCIDGVTRRTLPVEMFAADAAPSVMSIIPPYWQTAEMWPAHPPGTKGELCKSIIIASATSRY